MRFVLLLLLVFCISFSQEINVSSIGHNSNYISLTKKIISSEALELENFFGDRRFPIDVYLFNSHNIFQDSTGLGDNVQGVLLSNRNVIFLKTPELTATKLDDYNKLIKHELIHLFHNQNMPINLFPDWFSEGIAVYLSDGFQLPQKIQLSKILLNKNLPTTRQLQHFDLSHSTKASSDYILSASIIEFMILAYGNEVLVEIFNEMQQTKNFRTALNNVTRLDISLFNFYWKQYLQKEYSSFFLLDLQYILWLFLPILFIFSLIVKLIQNQFIINSWKYETFEEEINRIFTDPPGDNKNIISPGTLSVK